MEIRVVDGAMYLGGSAATAKEMDGKSWMKFDISGMAKGADGSAGIDASKLSDQADQDPSQASTYLTGSKDVKKVGTRNRRRADHPLQRHGHPRRPPRRAQEEGQGDAGQAREEPEAVRGAGADKLTMDMWVGPDDHTKQVRVRAASNKGPLDMTMVFLDYNKPVTVKAPPAKDTPSTSRS